jgi:hypothetical protein
MNVLTRISLLVCALATALVLAGGASAKGPIAATITGPGLLTPLKLSYANAPTRDAMQKLTADGYFFQQAFNGGARATKPPGSLGPRYLVVLALPGPGGTGSLRQYLYPYASAGAVTFMTKGQRFWDSRRTRGGWSRGSHALTEALLAVGLPAR